MIRRRSPFPLLAYSTCFVETGVRGCGLKFAGNHTAVGWALARQIPPIGSSKEQKNASENLERFQRRLCVPEVLLKVRRMTILHMSTPTTRTDYVTFDRSVNCPLYRRRLKKRKMATYVQWRRCVYLNPMWTISLATPGPGELHCGFPRYLQWVPQFPSYTTPITSATPKTRSGHETQSWSGLHAASQA